MFPLPYAVTDVHVHVQAPEQMDPLVARGARFGITRFGVSAVLAGGEDPASEQCRQANDCVLAARDRHPDAALAFCYVNPRHTDEALAELDRCVSGEGMVGAKLWIALPASDERVAAVVRHAAALGVPVLQHAWYKAVAGHANESTPADVALLARRVPEATIVMAHLFGGGQRGIADIAGCPNVLADCCGGEPEVGRMEEAVADQRRDIRWLICGARTHEALAAAERLAAMGNAWVELSNADGLACLEQIAARAPADRLLFATHMPFFYPEANLLKLVESDLADDVREAMLWRNARELFGLDAGP